MIYRYQVHGNEHEVVLERQAGKIVAVVDGLPYEVELLEEQPGLIGLRLEGRSYRLYWAVEEGKKWISDSGCTYLLVKPSRRRGGRAGETSSERIVRAPMPAQVRSVEVFEGDWVEKGQTLLLLEAMKMEIRVQAPITGRVIRMAVSDGQPVERDELLVEMGEES